MHRDESHLKAVFKIVLKITSAESCGTGMISTSRRDCTEAFQMTWKAPLLFLFFVFLHWEQKNAGESIHPGWLKDDYFHHTPLLATAHPRTRSACGFLWPPELRKRSVRLFLRLPDYRSITWALTVGTQLHSTGITKSFLMHICHFSPSIAPIKQTH